MSLESRMRYGLQTIGILVCVGLLSASYTLAYQPLQRKHEENLLKRNNVRQLAEKHEIVVARNATLELERQRLTAEVDALTKQIAKRSREHELLREISQTARTSKSQLVDFQPSGSGQFNELPTSIVRLTLRGNYPSLCRFLADLKEGGRLHRITQLSLQPSGQANADYDLRLELQWYRHSATNSQRS